MTSRARLSVCDKLLVSAYRLAKGGTTPFTAEDLVVAAWQEFPDTFGLRGHHDDEGKPKYPDSNRVFAEVMGAKPIRKRGLLAKVGQKVYTLTETGRDLGAQLDEFAGHDRRGVGTDAKVSLSREIVRKVRHLLNSRAVQKIDSGDVEGLTFHDACVFWGITPHSSAIQMQNRLANVEGAVSAAKRSLGNGVSRLEHGGEVLSDRTLELIKQTDATLRKQFQAELETIGRRTDERRA